MNKVWQIAHNTFRESVRDKVLYVIVFFSFLMMIASHAIGWVSVGDKLQIVMHFSTAVVSFFGALIAVFVGTGLIYKEIDKRTIYTILSKPVMRWQFVIGKFLGLVMVLFCVVLGMGVIACAFVWYTGGMPTVPYFQALILVFFELVVVMAMAILFSTAASPVLSAIFTFCAYLIGQVTPKLIGLMEFKPAEESVSAVTGESLTDFVSTTHWILKPLSSVFYWVLPDLSHFHLRNRIVHGPAMTGEEFACAILYAVLYSAAILLLSVILFDRKRF